MTPPPPTSRPLPPPPPPTLLVFKRFLSVSDLKARFEENLIISSLIYFFYCCYYCVASDPQSSSLFVFMIFTPPLLRLHLHTHIPLSLCLCLSVCLSVCLSDRLWLNVNYSPPNYSLCLSVCVCMSGSVSVRPSDCVSLSLSLCLSHPLPVQLWIRITSSFCFLTTRKTQSRIYPRNPSGGYMLTSISPKLNTATNQISKKTHSLFPWKASGIVR